MCLFTLSILVCRLISFCSFSCLLMHADVVFYRSWYVTLSVSIVWILILPKAQWHFLDYRKSNHGTLRCKQHWTIWDRTFRSHVLLHTWRILQYEPIDKSICKTNHSYAFRYSVVETVDSLDGICWWGSWICPKMLWTPLKVSNLLCHVLR